MRWLDRALAGLTGERSTLPLSWGDYQSYFNFQGNTYAPFMGGGTLTGNREEIAGDFTGYTQGAYRGNAVVFACMAARSRLFSEARFQFQRMLNGTPGDLFGSPALAPLETPWVNATTRGLLQRAIQDVDLAGNFYGWRPDRVQNVGRLARNAGRDEIHRLRPDWVTIILGSNMDGFEENPAQAPDVQVVGYIYHPGGYANQAEPILLNPEAVAHWAPNPDPLANFRGMSWLTPVLRDVMSDSAATSHKLKFLEQGATANTVVIAQPQIKNPDMFDVWQAKMKHSLEGLRNAYKTLYLANGADAKVIGSDLKQIDFKAVQGAGETRVAAAAGVPPIIVGLSEGLAASTYSNYAQARRAFADMTMRPLWGDFAGVMQTVIDVPSPERASGAARLWYDDRHIPFLAEEVKDTAELQRTNAETIHTLVIGGFTPESSVTAVLSGDYSVLKHSGMFSVQLTPAGVVGEGKGALVQGAPAATDAKPAEKAPTEAKMRATQTLTALRAAGNESAGRALAALLKTL